MNVSQQGHMLDRTALSSNMFDLGPGNRDDSFAIGQTDHQQLMSEANLDAIHDQTNLSQVTKLGFQPHPGDRLVPFPHSNGRIVQQPTQVAGHAQQFGPSRDLACNAAQAYRPAFMYAGQQSGEIVYLYNPLARSKLLNPLKQI